MSSACETKDAALSLRETSPDTEPSQEELRERYEQQQRRLACPACGEEPFLG